MAIGVRELLFILVMLGSLGVLVWALVGPHGKQMRTDVSGEIERLHKLVRDGALTQEEIEARKRVLPGS